MPRPLSGAGHAPPALSPPPVLHGCPSPLPGPALPGPGAAAAAAGHGHLSQVRKGAGLDAGGVACWLETLTLEGRVSRWLPGAGLLVKTLFPYKEIFKMAARRWSLLLGGGACCYGCVSL